MPRAARIAAGGVVYHVLNRANAGAAIFQDGADYEQFERILGEAHERVPMRTVGYLVMPNHWHLVLWPREDGDLSQFMRWLTLTHTQWWHAAHGTAGAGHLYQGRFKSFPVQSDAHLLTVCRYVERNALRARLVDRAERWRWGSLWRRRYGGADAQALLADGPLPLPTGWVKLVNDPQTPQEEEALRGCVARGRPFGGHRWVKRTAGRLGLLSTLRPRGRPKKDSPRAASITNKGT